MLSLSSTKIIC